MRTKGTYEDKPMMLIITVSIHVDEGDHRVSGALRAGRPPGNGTAGGTSSDRTADWALTSGVTGGWVTDGIAVRRDLVRGVVPPGVAVGGIDILRSHCGLRVARRVITEVICSRRLSMG